jgi:hypothetical protein
MKYFISKYKTGLLCEKCLGVIREQEIYFKTGSKITCQKCKEKQLITCAPAKDYSTSIKLASIGSKLWQEQLIKAIKSDNFKISISPEIYSKSVAELTADVFNVKYRHTLEEKQVKKAKAILADLTNQGLL